MGDQVGNLVRAVRIRRGLRQEDLARRASVSRTTVSDLECGSWDSMTVATMQKVAAAVDVRVELVGRYRGGDASRLLSRRHSLLASRSSDFAARQQGWVFEPEVSFAVFGERGAVDQLGWHEARAHLLVVELKTEFADVNEMLATLDRKVRLARTIAAERGWQPRLVSAWLIVLDTRTNRRNAAEHRALLRARFRTPARRFRALLRDPVEPALGMSFVTYGAVAGVRQSQAVKRVRIRPARPSVDRSDSV